MEYKPGVNILPHCVQYNGEEFSSLYMVQDIFCEKNLHEYRLMKKPKEIELVQKPPVVWFFNDQNIAKDINDFASKVGNGNCTGLADTDISKFLKNENGPFAIVVCFNPDGTHGNCRLSEQDKEILRHIKDILVGRNNVVYLVKGKRHHNRYNTEDLMALSTAVSSFINADENLKNIFRKIFFIEEEQAIFRIGLCFLDSIVHYLKTILDLKIDTQFISIKKENNGMVAEKKEARNGFGKKIAIAGDVSQEKLKQNIRREKSKAIARGQKIPEEQPEDIFMITVDLINIVRNEINTIEENTFLHEFKTVALRHGKVNGFGCRQESLCISLKANNEKDKEEVRKFLLNNFDNTKGRINGKYDLVIQFREKEMHCFSNLQQGSKIQINSEHFGSVGMFLHHEDGSYFFTTCEHVIGQNAYAFSPDNNSKIGVNIFAYKSRKDSCDRFMDFSVVKISPEREILCSFGLRTFKGDFTDFRVFKGDIVEVKNRQMYIWGATDLQMRFAKCIECSEENGLISFCVDSENFARPGDSGSIICVGHGAKTSYAAFVLVGALGDIYTGEYAGYKVSDAIGIMNSNLRQIKPILSPRNVRIASSPFSDEVVTPKRKKKETSESSSS